MSIELRSATPLSLETALARAGKPPGQSQQQQQQTDDSRTTTRPPSPLEEESGPDGSVDDGSHGRHEFSLPPTDTGKDAWLFLLASFMMEAFVWGTVYKTFIFLPHLAMGGS